MAGQNLASKPILVTGATGFLGGAVSRALLQAGHSVLATGRKRGALKALGDMGAKTLALDLSNPIATDVPDFETVVHCAGFAAPGGRKSHFESANVDATRAIIDLAKRKQVKRLVHISTPSLYFRFEDQDQITEDAPLPPPINAYADTKGRAEKMVLAAPELDPIILRPRGLYGAGDQSILPRLIEGAKRRPLPLLRGGAAATDLTYLSDAVDAVLSAIDVESQPDNRRVFNISGGVALPIKSVAEAVCAKADVTLRWRKMPYQLVHGMATASERLFHLIPGFPEPPITPYAVGFFAFRQTLNLDRARDCLGWTPKTSFEDGLEKTFQNGNPF